MLIRTALIRAALIRTVAAIAALLTVSLAPPGGTSARADAVAETYKNRPVTFVVVIGAGGTYGLYARLIANHIAQYVPGNPNIVVQHMAGAGGLTGTNYLYNVAPKDGSYIGMVFKDIAVVQALRPKDVRYDARQFNWIGSLAEYVALVMVWSDVGVKTFEEAKKTEVVVGTTGRNNHGYMLAKLMNELLGTKFKIISGYRGAADMHLAMEQGESHARIGTWDSIITAHPDWVREGKVVPIAQASLNKSSAWPDLPLFLEMVNDPKEKQMVEVVDSGSVVGWSVSMPPGAPRGHVEAWRQAFDMAIKDPALHEEAKRLKMEVNPKSGAEIQTAIDRTLNVDPDILEQLRGHLID